MKTDLFLSCGHYWVFQICWHIECSTFTAPSFRIWNSSAGIPSLPLAFFVVMLPKAHLTSHSALWRSFLHSSSVYSCHLFLISSVSVRSILFLSFIVLVYIYIYSPSLYVCAAFWVISSNLIIHFIISSHSIVFFYFFALITEVFLSLFAILWNSAFKLVYLSFSTFAFHFSSFHS